MTDSATFRAAISGAGPSAFYAADDVPGVAEPQFAGDLYDRRPTPCGPVWPSVAPGDLKIAPVTRARDKTSEEERFRFFGHLEPGGDISLERLLKHHYVVRRAIGTSIDERLRIPGEELRVPDRAPESVAWRHPDRTGLEVDLQSTQVAAIGAGNVAMNVARMPARAPSGLEITDTADHAIEMASASPTEEIAILARRGSLQVACTNPELLEMAELERGMRRTLERPLNEADRG